MHLPPATSHAFRVVRALSPRLTVLLACWLIVPAIHADPYSSPPALPPADLATLQISATPERTTYLLGETVRVRYAVANHGTEPITLRRDNDTTFWRPESLTVLAFDAVTGAPVPAAPSGMDIFNYRYGRRHSIAPGETWSHDFFLLRHVELPGPGRYRFQLRHTLGWPDKSTAPAAPEFTLEFAAPAPEQAAALVAAAPPLGSPEDDTPQPVDTFGFNYPVYIPALVKRIAAGEPALLDSLDRMATPGATAALIELSTNPHRPVAIAARRKLLPRIPLQTGIVIYGGDTWPGFPNRENREDAAWTPAEVTSARALARSLLREDLPPLDASGSLNLWDSPAFVAGALLARLGETADLPDLAQGLQTTAYARTLDAASYHNPIWRFSGDETDALRRAYAGMHARGIRARPTSTQLGEAILAFDAARLAAEPAGVTLFSDDFRKSTRSVGPRSPAWLDQLNLLANLIPWPAGSSSGERPGYLGDPATHRPPHPVLLIAALESIPAPLPPECVPFVNFALESNVPHVIHAACAVAVETRSPVFIPALLRVLRTESNPQVRATVAKAVAQLGDRRAALRALVDDIPVTPEPELLLRNLADILFGRNEATNHYSIPPRSRTERLALGEVWQTFLRENETRLAQEPCLAPGDAIIPASLFAGSIAWRLPNGRLWPEHAE